MQVRLRIPKAQYAGMQWGLMLAGAWVVASMTGAYGIALLWAALAVQAACGGIVCWRRTGLWLVSLAMLIGSPVLAAGAVLTLRYGRPFSAWPGAWLPVLGGGLLVGMCFGFAEQHVHPDAWAAWARYQADKNGWDILMCRHIPDLRGAPPDRVS